MAVTETGIETRSTWLTGPAGAAWLMFAVTIASSIKVRDRDPQLATSGVVDTQIAVELGLWALAAALVVARVVKRGSTPLNTPARLHQILRWQGGLVLLFLVTSLWSPAQPVSVVRAVQLAIMYMLSVTILTEWSHGGIERLWVVLRRLLWLFVVAGVVLTAIVPLWQPFIVGFAGDVRYRFFSMHPISTGSVLGLALIALVSTQFGTPDPWFARPSMRVVRWGALAGASGLLVSTGSRGAMVATVVAVGALIAVSPQRSTRRLLAFGVAAAVLIVAMGVGASALGELVLRGQNLTQVAQLSGRFELAAAAVPLLEDRVLFGNGYLAARSVFLQLAWGAGESHNMVLEILFSTGLFGLVVLGGFLGSLGKGILERLPLRLNRPLSRQAVALFLYPLLNGVVASGFIAGPGSGLLSITLAVMFVLSEPSGRSAT